MKFELINTIIKKIDNNEKIIDFNLSKEKKDFIHTLNLITTKPVLFICNVDESSIINGNVCSKQVVESAKKENNQCVIVSAEIESQIAELKNENDKLDLLCDLNLTETTLKKIIHAGYNLLNLITFFTSEPKETKAWAVKQNTTASKAAGKIHTDFEKGFIRAETISCDDFINLKGETACREAGKLRKEGKDYVVKDGDVFRFLFNV